MYHYGVNRLGSSRRSSRIFCSAEGTDRRGGTSHPRPVSAEKTLGDRMTVVVDRPTLPVIDTSARLRRHPLAASPQRRSADVPAAARRSGPPRVRGLPRAVPRRRPGDRAGRQRAGAGAPPVRGTRRRGHRDLRLLPAAHRLPLPRRRRLRRRRFRGRDDRSGSEARSAPGSGSRSRPEDFDSLAGVVGGQRTVDHDEVVRLRRAHPDESLERIARRLGCSLSTVKRHLRRERNEPAAADRRGTDRVRPRPRSGAPPAEILAENSGSRRAAA